MRRALSLLSFVGVSTLAASALAWAPIASGSPTWSGAVPYSLNSAGSADLGGFGPTETEVRRAMDDWTRVSCTSLTTNYRGSTTRSPGNYEGTSTIGWIESGWPHDGSAIGVTGPRWGASIIEADMAMNGVNFRWTAGSGSFSNVNAYSIILHEGGHFYGLGHSSVSGSSMWPSYSGGIVSLATDDENGICALYPGSGSDCTSTGCPSGQECVSGRCQAVVGDGTVCAPCSSDADCGGPSDLCLRYPDGVGYCGRACGSDADCSGDVCLGTSGGINQCGRVVGGAVSCAGGAGGCTLDSDCGSGQICSAGSCRAAPPGAGLGAACTQDSDCQSSLCLAGACTQTCDWTTPSSGCPAGFYCGGDASSCDRGYCRSGSAGASALGDPCAADTECASLLCASGRCSTPCIPGGALACPATFTCQVGTLPCRGSCQRSGALGDACERNEDCTTLICAVTDTRTFCTDFCDPMDPCPEGFTCTSAGGDVSVCEPDFGGLGHECATNEDCVSGICARSGDGTFCTRVCDDVMATCPRDFVCAGTSDPAVSVCTPTAEPPPGGCACRAAPGSNSLGPFAWGIGLLAFLWGWRRRRRSPRLARS